MTWPIPIEVVRACAVPAGTAELTRLALNHATIEPLASLERRRDWFVALVGYEDAAFPGERQETVVKLAAFPQENA